MSKKPFFFYWTEDVAFEAKAFVCQVPRPEGIPSDAEPVGMLYTREAFGGAMELPEGLRWFPIEGGTWVARNPGAVLDPSVLWRGKDFRCHEVVIAGAVWRVPVARLMGGGSGLPSVRALGEDGRGCWRVLPQYADLAGFAERVFDRLTAGESFSDADGDAAVAAALGFGYRIGLQELLLAEVLDEGAIAAVVKALIDWPAVEAALRAQKKTGDICGTGCGGQA
jgi:hypothetical protein